MISIVCCGKINGVLFVIMKNDLFEQFIKNEREAGFKEGFEEEFEVCFEEGVREALDEVKNLINKGHSADEIKNILHI